MDSPHYVRDRVDSIVKMDTIQSVSFGFDPHYDPPLFDDEDEEPEENQGVPAEFYLTKSG